MKRIVCHAAVSLSLTLLFFQPPASAGDSLVDGKVFEESILKPAGDRWRFTLAMPGWLAATSGTIGLDGIDSDVYLGADTLIKHLDMIATFSAEARKGRFGIYGDLLYVSASDGIGQDGLIEKVDVRLDQYLVDMELNYRVLEGPRGFLDVRAGVRYTNLYSRISISPDDGEIDRASTRLVDDIGQRIRDRLSDLDLAGLVRTALKDRISGELPALDASRRKALPIAPLGARTPDRLDELIRAALQRRAGDLADAVRARAKARTDALRDRAQKRIDAVKKRIAKEIASKLKDELHTSATLAEDWWDPYVGLRGRLNLYKAFYLTAKGDIGGFGVGSNLTWQASGALGCQVTRNLHTELGYRYLYTDYDKDNFKYQVTQSGVEITAGITF